MSDFKKIILTKVLKRLSRFIKLIDNKLKSIKKNAKPFEKQINSNTKPKFKSKFKSKSKQESFESFMAFILTSEQKQHLECLIQKRSEEFVERAIKDNQE